MLLRAAALYLALCSPCFAQSVALTPQTAPVEAAVASPEINIPAGTEISVVLAEPLSSSTSQIGDLFALRLSEPIIVDGREIVSAGALGGGEVIDAKSSGIGGRQGRLILSGRFLVINGEQVRIRGLRWTGAGEARVNQALALSFVPYAGVASIFLHGGEVVIPEGAQGVARIAVDLEFPIFQENSAPVGRSEGGVQTQ